MVSRFRSKEERYPRPLNQPGPQAARRGIRPSLMVLEPRTLLSTLTVTNTNDSGNGSLRFEISQASANDVIAFDPSLFSGGARTINVISGPLSLTKNRDHPGALGQVANDQRVQFPGGLLRDLHRRYRPGSGPF